LSTKLRLLLDECVPPVIAAEIKSCSGILSVKSITAEHFLGNKKTPDEAVVDYARQVRRVVVTTETRLNEKKYTICTHPGIIVINATNRHELEKAKLFTRFMKSGHRAASKHAVTKLRVENSVRVEMAPDGTIREIPIHF
jgi:predicted nuclease of predicted toxin-antitoxin system